MKFRCNATTETANKAHTDASSRISTIEEVDHYSSSITSGVVSMNTDITNGALGTKNYSCPKCHEKLLWDKKHAVNGNELGSAVGTFTMVQDDGQTEAEVNNQYGVDIKEEDDNDNSVDTESLPEYGQARYNYKRTEWVSETESDDQKQSISWTDSQTGVTYYGTKAMNHIERGIFEANRKYSFKELQTKNLAAALLKLRMNKETSIAMWGDSIFAGFWYLEDEENKQGVYEPDSFEDDYGMVYEGYDRCVKRIPEIMEETLNKVYNGKIKMSRRVWNGVTVCNKKTPAGKPVDYSITSHWKASEKDIAMMNFGVNDAVGIHLDIKYAGNVSQFIEGYKALIERELEHGTAVIVVSPFRLCTVGATDIKADLDDRTIIDVYEQSLYSLCQEYGIPFIDGSLMLKNFGSELYLDLSHLRPLGNEAAGKRLASVLIGQNPLRPLKVHHNTYLSVIPQYSNCKLTGTANLSYSETSPNIKTGVDVIMKYPEGSGSPSTKTRRKKSTPTVKPTITINKPAGAIQCDLKQNGDSIVWSFYAEHDGMVVIPTFENKTAQGSVIMELDFNATQGSWSNYWNYKGFSETIEREEYELALVTYDKNDLEENRYGYHMLSSSHDKAIKIVSEGWHTIKLEAQGLAEEEIINVFGITFMDLKEFEKATEAVDSTN